MRLDLGDRAPHTSAYTPHSSHCLWPLLQGRVPSVRRSDTAPSSVFLYVLGDNTSEHNHRPHKTWGAPSRGPAWTDPQRLPQQTRSPTPRRCSPPDTPAVQAAHRTSMPTVFPRRVPPRQLLWMSDSHGPTRAQEGRRTSLTRPRGARAPRPRRRLRCDGPAVPFSTPMCWAATGPSGHHSRSVKKICI